MEHGLNLHVLANCDLECYDDYFDCPGLAVYELMAAWWWRGLTSSLGDRILAVLLRECRVPDDLGYLLARHDPKALEELQELIERVCCRGPV